MTTAFVGRYPLCTQRKGKRLHLLDPNGHARCNNAYCWDRIDTTSASAGHDDDVDCELCRRFLP